MLSSRIASTGARPACKEVEAAALVGVGDGAAERAIAGVDVDADEIAVADQRHGPPMAASSARGVGGRPGLVPVLQEGRKSQSIDAKSRVIRVIQI